MSDDTDLEDLDMSWGSAARHVEGAASVGTELLDRLLGDDDHVSGGPIGGLRGRVVEPAPPQATNQATMECLRGPCVHLWSITARFHAQSDKINIARVRQCNCHYEPTDLTEQNVYHCDQWWPSWAQWIPESWRPLMRRAARRAWEWQLRHRGYDFSWRTWSDDVFETNRKGQREHGALGTAPATFATGRVRPVEGVTETADGLFFNAPGKGR